MRKDKIKKFLFNFFLNKEMNNVKNEINNNVKTINTIIKDLSISPQKKLYIYLDSKPHEMINEKN